MSNGLLWLYSAGHTGNRMILLCVPALYVSLCLCGFYDPRHPKSDVGNDYMHLILDEPESFIASIKLYGKKPSLLYVSSPACGRVWADRNTGPVSLP